MSDRAVHSHYEVLGVSTDATGAEIRRAYRRLARRHHPDVDARDGAERRFRALTDAYQVLLDPARRAEYDRATSRPRVARAPPAPFGAAGPAAPRHDVPRFLDEQPRRWTIVIDIGERRWPWL